MKTRSEVASKLGTDYHIRSRAVSLKMAKNYVHESTDDNVQRDEEYLKSLSSFSLKAGSVDEMQSWVDSIRWAYV